MTTDISTPPDALSITDSVPWPLHDLGVAAGTLDARQREALDRDGCLLLPAHLAPTDLATLRETYDRLMREKYAHPASALGGGTSDFWFHESGTRRLTDLLSEGEAFERMTTAPLLLAAVHRLMRRPFKHDAINAREALPGQGAQSMHRDHRRSDAGLPGGVNSAWLLDAFTADNGPTRIVPGSHRWTELPEQRMADPAAAFPGEILVEAPVGSVLIFSGSLWHSGTTNRSGVARRVIHCSFVGRDCDLGARAQRLRIRKATYDRLSPAARWLIDV